MTTQRSNNRKATDKYGPVGAVIWSSYWQHWSVVISHNSDGTVTERTLGESRIRRHRTPLERRDRVITGREAQRIRELVEPLGHVIKLADNEQRHLLRACVDRYLDDMRAACLQDQGNPDGEPGTVGEIVQTRLRQLKEIVG